MRRLGLVLLAAATVASTSSINSQAQSVSTHHVREAIKNGQAQANGHLPGNQVLGLNIVLPLRDPQGLKAFLADIYNPASPNFHHFVTPADFTAHFGPTQAQYDAVVNFATANGLTITGGSRDGMNVQVNGTVSSIESAFHISMRTYRHPHENRTFYGPDSEPVTNLGFSLWHISGLDNYSIPQPRVQNINDYAKAHNLDVNGVVSHATTGSGPSASFLGSDMRAAYYGSGSLNGTGQNLGLWEYVGTNLQDLNTYYANTGQKLNVPITLLSVDGTSTSCNYAFPTRCDDTEQNLDMTQALGMAPNLASLTMYIGSSDTAIAAAMTTHSPLPMTIGCSWGWSPVDPNTLDPYFQKMAAQGQSFFTASGDSSTWTSSGNSAPWPADDANVISVGGTDLVTASAGGPWQSEIAWVDSGGGVSTNNIAIPSWQQLAGVINSSNSGSTTLRNGPDVSANANFTFYTCANQKGCLANTYGGTSFAAPMWAGYAALANQQLAGKSTVGFINPTIYNQNINSSSYAADFHDITSGTSGSYSAVSGFDLVTGWGSPNAGLMAALTGGGSTTTNPSFTIASSSSSVSVVQGTSGGATTITVTPTNGFNSNVTLSAPNLPTGVTANFATNPITGGSGTSSLTFTVGSSVATGTYSVTITGTGNGVTQSTTVQLTVTAAQQTGSFSLSANPASFSVSRSRSGSTTITSLPNNGFSSNVSLSASNTGGGVSVSFSPNSISANGTATMTVSVSKNAPLGTRNIVVTGTSGSLSNTATVSVTVTH